MLLVLAGCFELSPHAVVLDASERALHARALASLAATPPGEGEVVRFALVGDTQLAFDEAADAVAHLNARGDLAFVVQLGDFTHVGLLPEYRRMNAIFARLEVPYFVVVGIHDLLGNGGEIYARMFGPRNATFTFGRTRFVLFDSNSRAEGFRGDVPDLAWLGGQLARDGPHDRTVLLSHVAPGTGDFDPALVEAYDALLSAIGPVISFHAHEHRPRFEDRAGTPVWIADSVDHRSYLVATVGPGAVEVERVAF